MDTDNGSNQWWSTYRNKKYKPRTDWSTEIIVRKTLVGTAKEYVEQGTLSVLRKIFNTKIMIMVRLFWLAVLVSLFGMICYFLLYTWRNTFDRPFVISSESNTHTIADIDFPALALCNINRISKKALKKLAQDEHSKLKHSNLTIDELEEFYRNMGRLIDFNYKEGTPNPNLLAQLYSSESDTQSEQGMRKLAPSCEDMLIRCKWAGQVVACSTIFALRRTALGHCCVFNYVLKHDNNRSLFGPLDEVKRQTVPGRHYGLNVIIDPMLDDYAFTLSPRIGFDVLIFDPIHFAAFSGGRVTHRLVEPNVLELFQLESVRQLTSKELSRYPVSTRQCLFRDERQDEFHGMYSYSACLVRCRIETIKSMCRCTPYFVSAAATNYAKNTRTCTLKDLYCLDKHREKFLYWYPLGLQNTSGLEQETADSLYCPKCLPDCEYTKHTIKSFKINIDEVNRIKYLKSDFSLGVNLTNRCVISIYQPIAGSVVHRLDVVAYWFEILSNIGGFAGMQLGIGIFTVTEIIYFFCIRLLRSLYLNYIKYHY